MGDSSDIQSLREALAATPDNVILRRMLAEALCRNGQCEEAITEFRSCLRHNPTDEDTLLGLALAYKRLGKLQEGIVVSEQLLKSNSPSPAALELHAELLLADGQQKVAAKSWIAAKQAEPMRSNPDLEDALKPFLEANLSHEDGDGEEFASAMKAGPAEEMPFLELWVAQTLGRWATHTGSSEEATWCCAEMGGSDARIRGEDSGEGIMAHRYTQPLPQGM
ncbi:MAG: tetratricopeptide repeat protein [Verrucomicrobiota bacterium]